MLPCGGGLLESMVGYRGFMWLEVGSLVGEADDKC